MDIGSLRRRLTLQRPEGLAADGYVPVATVWGSARFASGNELLRFGTPQAEGAWVITIRYRADVEASWRVLEGATGRSFQISNFGDPDGRRAELRLYCVEAQ